MSSGLGGGLFGGTGPLGTTITEDELVLADNTTANSSAARHGLLPKLSGNASDALRGDGTWGTVAAGIGGSTGATDNAILRADGTGGATAQTSAVQVDDSGHILPASTAAQDLGSSSKKWRRFVIDDIDGIIMHNTGSGTENRLNYTNGTGPRWYDGGNEVALTHNIQALSVDRTATWPNIAGTVVVGSAVGTTVGAAGGASALPAAPLGYLSVTLPDGTLVKVPYYNT